MSLCRSGVGFIEHLSRYRHCNMHPSSHLCLSVSASLTFCFSFACMVLSTPFFVFFFFAPDFFFSCFFSKSPRNHSKPFYSKQTFRTNTHNMCCLEAAVDGGGQGLGLAQLCTISLNYSSSIIAALMSSTHSPATVTSSAIESHCPHLESGY